MTSRPISRLIGIGFSIGVLGALAVGCAADASDPSGPGTQTIDSGDLVKPEDGKADASHLAVFLTFEFDGEVLVSSTWNTKRAIEDQLLYTIGLLNGEKSVGRLDTVELSDIRTEPAENGKTRVLYHAKLPVAWGKKDSVPTTYTLRLPKDGTYQGYEAFTQKYSKDCVDWGAHDVTAGSMWYYYRPKASRCTLAQEDVVDLVAEVRPSGTQTTGKYPEYDKVWEDGVLEVVAVYGKYEDNATSNSDAGISAYNEFVRAMKTKLGAHSLVTTPATFPSSPGVGTPDITFEATLADGKKTRVVALLVDNVRTAGATFNTRYASLTPTADYIVYNGHAGLGANVQALAQKGKWVAGQWAMVFMNGCDTFAYIDDALWAAHAAVNPGDPTGTKHVDIVTNAMPSYFSNMPEATMAIYSALLDPAEPLTYEGIFKKISSSQVVLVSGEEDNEFVPGGGGGNPEPWAGMNESGSVAKNAESRFETVTLEAGRYVFDMTGSGDADLYVRVGTAPTKSAYDCRPYRYGSKESCAVDITTPAPVHVMVRGWASSSNFTLVGTKQ